MVGVDVASYLLQDAGKFPQDHNLTARMNDYKSTFRFRSKEGWDQSRNKRIKIQSKKEKKKRKETKIK